MSKKRQLELAAKAAGYKLDCTIRPDGKPFYHSDRGAWALADGGWFAAWDDDADAFRLMSDLGVEVIYLKDSVEANHYNAGPVEASYKNSNRAQKAVATRRAIVRVAAEIGKNMP